MIEDYTKEKDPGIQLRMIIYLNCKRALMRNKQLQFTVCLVALLALALDGGAAQESCFTSSRLPKVIQSTSGQLASHAEAVTFHSGQNAIFTGGHVTQSLLFPAGATQSTFAHVGRINLNNNYWSWTKLLSTTAEDFNTVTALAVEPSGTKIAVHGFKPLSSSPTHATGYLVILDTSTGATVSGVLKMAHSGEFRVSSAGMVLQDDGTLFMALNHMGATRPNSFEQKMRLSSWSSSTNSMLFDKELSGWYGRSASLVAASGTHAGKLFLGGNLSTGSKWDLGFVKIGDPSNPDADTSVVKLSYYVTNCNSASSNHHGYSDTATAPYTSHIGYMEDGTSHLFGVTNGNDHAGNTQGSHSFAWRVGLDSNGEASNASFNFMLLDSTNFGVTSAFIGMRTEMEYDSSNYWIHAVYATPGTDGPFYIRVSPDTTTSAKVQEIKLSSSLGYEAVFNSAFTGTIGSDGNSFSGAQAYVAGSAQSYTAAQTSNFVDFLSESYAVWSSIEDADSCAHGKFASTTISVSQQNSCQKETNNSGESWTALTDTTYSDASSDFVIHDLQINQQMSESECNDGDPSITSVTAAANSHARQCFNYGPAGYLSFSPSEATASQSCSDTYWLYQVSLDASSATSPLPSNVVVSVDSQNYQVRWAVSDDSAPGADASFDFGVYTIAVDGTLMDDTYQQLQAFTFEIDVNCCASPTTFNTPTTTQTSYSYNIGDTALVIALSSDWTSDHSCCTLQPDTPVISPTPPAGLFTIAADNLSVTVSTSDLASSAITYTITTSALISACVTDVVSDVVYTVDIVNACASATLTFTDTIFKTTPTVTMQQYINYSSQTLTWTDSVFSSSVSAPDPCGAFTHELWDVTSGSPVAVDSAVFSSIDVASSTKTMTVYSADPTKAADYTLRIVAYYSSYTANAFSKDFLVSIDAYCIPTSVTPTTFSTASISYLIGQSQEVATFTDWTRSPSECALTYTSSVTPVPADASLITFDSASQAVTVVGSEIYTGNDPVSGTFVPGTYSVEVRAQADDGSDMGQSLTIVVTVTDPCADASIALGTPIFASSPITHTLGDTALVIQWDDAIAFTVTDNLADCSTIVVEFFYDDGLETALEADLFTDTRGSPNELQLNQVTDTSKVGTYNLTYKAYLYLDSGKEVRNTSQLVVDIVEPSAQVVDDTESETVAQTGEAQIEEETSNEAPYFLVAPRASLTIDRDSLTGQFPVVLLGAAVDTEDDAISFALSCEACDLTAFEGTEFTYVEETSSIEIPQEAVSGSYNLELTLTDDNVSSQSTLYKIQLTLEEPSVTQTTDETQPPEASSTEQEALVDTDLKAQNRASQLRESQADYVEPGFQIESMDNVGTIEISFNQAMQVPAQLTELTEEVLMIAHIADESNQPDDPETVFKFTWAVTSYQERSMQIKITFDKAEYMSAGLMYDMMTVSIIDASFFLVATEAGELPDVIKSGTTQEIKVVKQMPDDEWTQALGNLSDNMGDAANAVIVSNFAVNILLSGAMNLLWGLLHSMQIIAYMPLLNVLFPANAELVYHMIIQIATFDMIPVDKVIVEVEDSVNVLSTRKLSKSDSFDAFGFDSSDPIALMQIMFLFLLFLFLWPFITMVLRGIFFCCPKCWKCLEFLDRKIFWNTYVRFMLETYLEIMISCCLRFDSISFDDATEIFQSVFAIVLMVILCVFTLFTPIYLMTMKNKTDSKEFKQKCGDLALGLRHNSHAAHLHTTFFMVRRLLYALIIVLLFERNYFQIQSMLFMTSLIIIYSGYVNPFETRSANTIEFVNETLTLLCIYSLITFSAFVPDAAIRYQCGWFLVFVTLLMLVGNLVIILYSAISRLIHRCKLKALRRKNIKLFKKRQLQSQQKELRAKLKNQQKGHIDEQKSASRYLTIDGFGPVAYLNNQDQHSNSVQLRTKQRDYQSQPSATLARIQERSPGSEEDSKLVSAGSQQQSCIVSNYGEVKISQSDKLLSISELSFSDLQSNKKMTYQEWLGQQRKPIERLSDDNWFTLR